MLLEASKTSVLIIDMQERLLPVVTDAEGVEKRCAILLKAARALEIPVTVSEHCPDAHGSTVPGLKAETGDAAAFGKFAFSCWRDEALKTRMIGHHERGRPLVVAAGIEAHVSVLQTCIDLAVAGFGVFAVADAMSSRQSSSVALALDRMRQAGVQIVNTEMAIFELLQRQGTAESKALSGLVR